MSSDCENFVRRREAEAAMDLELNPQVFQHCHDEMNRVCKDVQPDEMIDCLKANMADIKSKACQAVSTCRISMKIIALNVFKYL